MFSGSNLVNNHEKIIYTALGNETSSVNTLSGGTYVLIVTGTFDGATLMTEVSYDGTNFVSAGSNGTVTSATNEAQAFQFPVGYIRVTVSGGGVGVSLNAEIRKVPR